ncbi:hypothetical protein BU26DRAFT_525218 [Trematosphaeria pertusa]|uniref:Aminoglycoside phosphotransferase domain-containing protein n=1 Tax=Trematosphaeria pertusa TaxID=390896 RepID=A0A6A6HUE9_9PLEO|nr:uncharacterized protein BU26DRAFT_525218 [Trematosphaeria pertusa]KAF2241388.1 hypothetical protein BU26DRAFT_525218 [Trematosphaeria pertusa]
MASQEVFLYRSEAKSYFWTERTFIKRELPDAAGLPWLKQRFAVEAATLRLLSDQTSIPVPRLIAFGEDEYGRCYLETECIKGSVRGDMAADECRMPQLHHPSEAKSPCAACEGIVSANAERFVQEVVLPQLSRLKSRRTGLEGIVIPPRWVSHHDKREAWRVLESPQADFVFCHNDLVLHNMLFCTQTLKVLALVDMEDCGYFPPEVQQWKRDRTGQFGLYEDMDLVRRHIQLIGG